MDFGQAHKNTDHAQLLDLTQELDYQDGLQRPSDVEREDHQRFLRVCRKAGYTYTQLKACEKEITRQTAGLREEIKALQERASVLESQIFWRKNAESLQVQLEKVRKRITSMQQQLDQTAARISSQFFGQRRKSSDKNS